MTRSTRISRREAVGGLAGALAAASCAGGPARAQLAAPLRFRGLLARVPDLADAVDFYGGLLGYRAVTVDAAAGTAELADDWPFYLLQTAGTAAPAFGQDASAMFSIHVREIMTAARALEAAGVTFVEERPTVEGIGLALKLRGPGGAVISMVETQTPPRDPAREYEMYNCGLHIPSIPAARPLWEALGFAALTETYLPRDLPLGHADGSFGFMLHERPVGPAPRWWPDGIGLALVLAADDLADVAAVAAAQGAEMRTDGEEASPFGPRIAFAGPDGVVVEVWRA